MNKKIVSILILIVIGSIILIYTFQKNEINSSNDTETKNMTYYNKLSLEDSHLTKEELEKKYLTSDNKSLEEIKKEIEEKVRNDNVSSVYEFSYNYNQTDINNKGKVFETITEGEGDFVELYGYDTIFYNCMAFTSDNPNYCLKINPIYFQVECYEGIKLIRAIRQNDSSLCEDIATKKLGYWCKAFLEKDTKYCEEGNFENVIFKENCIAFATQDIELCKDHDECYYDYYFLRGLYYNNPLECENIYDKNNPNASIHVNKAHEDVCKAEINRNSEFCINEYLPDRIQK